MLSVRWCILPAMKDDQLTVAERRALARRVSAMHDVSTADLVVTISDDPLDVGAAFFASVHTFDAPFDADNIAAALRDLADEVERER